MRVALLQLAADRGTPEDYRSFVKYLVQEEVPHDVAFVVLPELWTTGHLPQNIRKGVEVPQGPTNSLLAMLAKKRSLYIVGGSLPIQASQGISNFCSIYGPAGFLTGYAKVHPFGPMGEKEWCIPGRNLCLFSTAYGKMGVMICYDLRFPEVARALAKAGSRAVFVPAAFPEARIDQWELLLRARAVENQIFMVGVNKAGRDGNHLFPGKSLVVAPDGAILVEGARDEEILLCDLDFNLITQVRDAIPCWQDLSPRAYELLLEDGEGLP
ncbi:MAG: nitrilase-related carbon-nitrogen hydrolase [Bacillota bacterium]|nr:nitrilase-related carbon-nitrogen hydrolase [Bacillota bacterium]